MGNELLNGLKRWANNMSHPRSCIQRDMEGYNRPWWQQVQREDWNKLRDEQNIAMTSSSKVFFLNTDSNMDPQAHNETPFGKGYSLWSIQDRSSLIYSKVIVKAHLRLQLLYTSHWSLAESKCPDFIALADSQTLQARELFKRVCLERRLQWYDYPQFIAIRMLRCSLVTLRCYSEI